MIEKITKGSETVAKIFFLWMNNNPNWQPTAKMRSSSFTYDRRNLYKNGELVAVRTFPKDGTIRTVYVSDSSARSYFSYLLRKLCDILRWNFAYVTKDRLEELSTELHSEYRRML